MIFTKHYDVLNQPIWPSLLVIERKTGRRFRIRVRLLDDLLHSIIAESDYNRSCTSVIKLDANFLRKVKRF